MASLADFLDTLSAEGELHTRHPDGAVRCHACAHRCLIRPGRRGICGVRFNAEGSLRVPWGYVAALQCDPTEKKPFYHLLPGSDTMTFGMLGCDFHCSYCQNWISSQALRDPHADIVGGHIRQIEAAQIVEQAVRQGAQVVGSSYNEPLITSEWAVEVFKLARKAGLKCVFVSNGNATPEVLEYLRPYLAGYKVDLKTMQDRQYRKLGGVLQHVLDSIEMAHGLGMWVEVVTLVVPGFNDSNAELMETARFIASISIDIPWHVTAFHKDYRMTSPANTSVSGLIRAAEIGMEAGLRYVYAGNRPGQVEPFEHTACPQCGKLLIERRGYLILSYHLDPQGRCPQCATPIAGIWPTQPSTVRLRPVEAGFYRRTQIFQ